MKMPMRRRIDSLWVVLNLTLNPVYVPPQEFAPASRIAHAWGNLAGRSWSAGALRRVAARQDDHRQMQVFSDEWRCCRHFAVTSAGDLVRQIVGGKPRRRQLGPFLTFA